MKEYDRDFLRALDKARVRTHYAKIELLDFNELPIAEIQGKITAGSISVNSSSAIRRTLTMTMAVDNTTVDITNTENQISINKKIKVAVGIKNPLSRWIQTYGEIIWFPQGIYVISSVNSTRNTNSWTLSITAKDKMCCLDGSAGGTLPAMIIFHERYVEQDDGSILIEHPILRQIIYEAVNHYGGEAPEKIFINDLDDQVKMLVKYDGYKTLYFNEDFTSCSYIQDVNHMYPIVTGMDAGYEMTDFTYPGELVLNAGDTVVTLLNKIIEVLGNYEFFYDIDGNFVFQEIKNYVNNQSPLNQIETAEQYLPNLPARDYVRIYNNQQTAYQLTDLDTAAAITQQPKYDNIKNDFYVWGKTITETEIRYHLSIDAKPLLELANQYMWINSLGYYEFTETNTSPGVDYTLLSPKCDEWREELYRQALVAKTTSGFGSGNNYYYEELLTEWRKLYDPGKSEWNTTNHWNPDVYDNPDKLDFWLDFIDTDTDLGKYSIGQIGRRTKVVNNNDIKTIYNKEVPDIIFIPTDAPNKSALIDHYNSIGQKYFQLNSQFENFFSISATGASCYDEIRELLYQYLNYHTTISITCVPIYYLDANNLIYVEDKKSGIIGNYQITQFTLPLTYNGTMNISATEVFVRI